MHGEDMPSAYLSVLEWLLDVTGKAPKSMVVPRAMKPGFVYILTNKNRTTLYVGVTANLQRRIWEHKNKVIPGFTKRYNLDHLVYYEVLDSIGDAIFREKRIKKGTRSAKDRLIRSMNPNWSDLYDGLV